MTIKRLDVGLAETMIIDTQQVKQIKKTKRVFMTGNKDMVGIRIDDMYDLVIPAKLVFQVTRGLTSWKQQFYRKK